jgi:hypothetical protein
MLKFFLKFANPFSDLKRSLFCLERLKNTVVCQLYNFVETTPLDSISSIRACHLPNNSQREHIADLLRQQ